LEIERQNTDSKFRDSSFCLRSCTHASPRLQLCSSEQLKFIYAWQAGVSGSSNTEHTSCVTDELEEEDGIHTIEREACSRESHATVRVRTTLGSEASRVQVPASDTNQSRTLQYGESENTWKLTGSRMTLIERG
jgi:hypothetical protein